MSYCERPDAMRRRCQVPSFSDVDGATVNRHLAGDRVALVPGNVPGRWPLRKCGPITSNEAASESHPDISINPGGQKGWGGSTDAS